MHYTSIFICTVAVFLCFATRSTDGLPSSQQDTGARFALEESNKLLQLLEECDQSLDHAASRNCTFVATCKKLTALLARLLNTHHSIVPRAVIPGIDQIPLNQAREDDLQHTLLGMAKKGAEEVQIKRESLTARSYNIITRIFKRDYTDKLCGFKCPTKDLDKTCTAKKLKPKVAEVCKLCYPTPNPTHTSRFCQEKWRRKRRVFYIVCFGLIGLTLVSGMALRLRRLYVERGKHKQSEETRQAGELYHYDGTNPSAAPPRQASTLHAYGHDEPPGEPWDEEGEKEEDTADDIGSSTAHRKWKQVGLLSKAGRKRVQDLFDVEAMRSKRDMANSQQQQHQQSVGDKIPVMPRAPNATVRQMCQVSRGSRLERQVSQVELRQVRNNDTV